MVEDAGLFVDALNGFPGVHLGLCAWKTIGCSWNPDDCLNTCNSQDTVQSRTVALRRVPSGSRTCGTTVRILYGNGRCPGWIALESSEGEGFGFDPVFTPNDLDASGRSLYHPGNYGDTSTHGKDLWRH